MTKQEIALAAAAIKGKKNAYEKLCQTYYYGLCNLIVNATGDPSHCDEILKAVFEEARASLSALSAPADFEPMIINLVLAHCGHDYSESVPTTIQSDASFSASHPQEEEAYDPDKATYDYRSSAYAPEFSSIEADPDFEGFMTFFETGQMQTPSASDHTDEKIRTQVFEAEANKTFDTALFEEEIFAETDEIAPEFRKKTVKTPPLFLNRRSVKSFSDQPVEKEIIDAVIEAGLCAPSGMGKQSPIIIAVTDKETRDRLSYLNSKVMGADIDPFYGAPVVLAVLADRSVPTYLYDGSLAMGSMLLAASELGIGGCWIHRAKEVFDSPEGREILRDLGIEGDFEGIGNCVIGYPAGEPRPAGEIKPGRVFYI